MRGEENYQNASTVQHPQNQSRGLCRAGSKLVQLTDKPTTSIDMDPGQCTTMIDWRDCVGEFGERQTGFLGENGLGRALWHGEGGGPFLDTEAVKVGTQ